MNSKRCPFLFFFLFCLTIPVYSQNTDIDILIPINKHETDFKNKYFELHTASVNVLSVGIPIGIAVTGFIMHDNKLKQDALYMGAGFLVSTIITRSVKQIVNRQRPFYKYSFITKRDNTGIELSFPSGHTSASFCTATSLALRYRKWYVIVPAYLYATSVAWGRMYQGVHYPSDVLAGALVGAGSAWLGYKAQKWMLNKKERKKKLIL